MNEGKDEMVKVFGPIAEELRAKSRTYAVPSVRLTSRVFDGLLGEAIGRVNDRILSLTAAIAEQKKITEDAQARGVVVTGRADPYSPSPEVELEQLRGRHTMLVFTREHLVPDAVFEMDAASTAAFLFNVQNYGCPGGALLPR